MYRINLNVSDTREVILSSASGGTTGENNSVVMNFKIPSDYSSFNKYLDIYGDNGKKTQTVISVSDESEFSYVLPGMLSDNLNLYMQLVFKKDKTVFKSYKFVLTFEESINATGYLESEYKDSIQTLYEIKADKSSVEELSSAISDKLPYLVYSEDKSIILTMINQKADGDAVERALSFKADKKDVETSLSGKADKNEIKEIRNIIADNEKLQKNDFANALKTTVSAYKLKIDDLSPYVHTVKGKLTAVNNLIPYPFPVKVFANDGITIVMNEADRSITINGTPTRSIGLSIFEGELELDGKYILTGVDNSDGDLTPGMQPVVDGKWHNMARNSPYEYDLKGTLNKISLQLAKGVTYINEKITPCLVKKDDGFKVDMKSVVISCQSDKYYPKEDGSFELLSEYPEMSFGTNNPNLLITVEYNRDNQKALSEKADKSEVFYLRKEIDSLKSKLKELEG